MTVAQNVLEHYAGLLDTGARQPTWLAEQRRQALVRARTAGLPGKRVEAWHYSAVDQWLADAQQRHGHGLTLPDADIETSGSAHLPGAVFTFSHGYLSGQSDAANRLEGVELQPVALLDANADAELIQWLGERRDDALAALVDALAPEAWVLTIRAGTTVREPLVLHHRASQPGVHLPRVIVRVEAGARATVVEHFSGHQDCDYLSLSRSAIQVGRDAQLNYLRVNRDGNRGQHIGLVDLEQAQGSQLRLQTLAVGGARIRNGLNASLTGNDATFECGGAFTASDAQHVDYHIAINHRADRGTSRTLFHGLAGDRSTGIVNGRLYIAEHTRANDARLATHNLLLSNEATIDAKPELEIYAEEVSCAHGATIGQLDPDQLQYLRSRGIDRTDAITLLTEGFLRNGVLPMGGALADYLERQVAGALQRIDCDRIRL